MARVALRHGHTPDEIDQKLKSITKDTPVREVFDSYFDRVPDNQVEKALGTESRPVTHIRADDPYIRIWSATSPHFLLEAGDGVTVERTGETEFRVVLPSDATGLTYRTR